MKAKKQPEAATAQEELPIEKTQEQPAKQQEEKIWHYKGSNTKKVLIVVDQPDEEFINAEEEGFLGKILNAVKLDLRDVAIMNLQKNRGATITSLLSFDATKFLFFGITNKDFFEKDCEQYTLLAFDASRQLLNCSSLAAISQDASQKKLLWSALQKMFL
ncbi:DNA polymerase III subunit psi [Fulvivirga imtechensis]|uniref:DNA polymerase III subunit psi n=1 Tax=Fulvivirga imtechensis TaxID=881893 RepID=UPI0012F92AC3|nr:DNA polymerase III subunit psi [Fulvivirga imtechensis]